MQIDPESVDCRGVFRTDEQARYLFRTVRPLGYYIPLDGPVVSWSRRRAAAGCARRIFTSSSAHQRYRELVTALYLEGDEHLEDDVVFGPSPYLVVREEHNDPNCAIKGLPSIHFDFALARKSEADSTGGRVGADPSKIAGQS